MRGILSYTPKQLLQNQSPIDIPVFALRWAKTGVKPSKTVEKRYDDVERIIGMKLYNRSVPHASRADPGDADSGNENDFCC